MSALFIGPFHVGREKEIDDDPRFRTARSQNLWTVDAGSLVRNYKAHSCPNFVFKFLVQLERLCQPLVSFLQTSTLTFSEVQDGDYHMPAPAYLLQMDQAVDFRSLRL